MTRFSPRRFRALLASARTASTRAAQGSLYEDAICQFFAAMAGVSVNARNTQNAFATEEIDVVFWNDRLSDGLYFLQEFLFVECKNWSTAVGSQEVGYFVQKLRSRGLPFGVLVAANGVTGDADDRTRAHSVLASALQDGIRVIVLTNADLLSVSRGEEIVALIRDKLGMVVLRGVGF